ncbi:MAG: radical SAM protein [Candidatus Omnitrophica bacterium]|nr:radical SAM protein [Candidatus Omnitrophota bacterium]
MKVVLILTPSWGIETPPLGIALLAASLRKRGFKVQVFDFNVRFHNQQKERGLWKGEEDLHWESESDIAKFVKENNELLNSFASEVCLTDAQVIGFSIYNTTWRLSVELARRIKEKDKNRILIFGGQRCYPVQAAEGLINNDPVDAVVMGEGEEVLVELIDKIDKLKRIEFCPGVFYKKGGRVIDCGRRPAVANINKLPFPDFSDYNLADYDNPHQLSILSNRGCPYPCVFCSTKLFWAGFRSMNGQRMFSEIDYQLSHHKEVNFFTFNDHVVNADMRALTDFCELVIDAKLNHRNSSSWEKLIWRGAAVIRDEMSADFMCKMQAAGCTELEYGIESASVAIRKLMNKPPYDLGVLRKVIRDTHSAGIRTRVNFMFGFPGETEDDFQETLNFLKENHIFFDQVHASETFCHIDPGTYLAGHLSQLGVSEKNFHPLYWESRDGRNTYPQRLRRHQEFCQLAVALGIPLSSGGHKIMLHKEYFLEEYNRYKKENIVGV